MSIRHEDVRRALESRGTHFAVIDAVEALVGNRRDPLDMLQDAEQVLDLIRLEVRALAPELMPGGVCPECGERHPLEEAARALQVVAYDAAVNGLHPNHKTLRQDLEAACAAVRCALQGAKADPGRFELETEAACSACSALLDPGDFGYRLCRVCRDAAKRENEREARANGVQR